MERSTRCMCLVGRGWSRVRRTTYRTQYKRLSYNGMLNRRVYYSSKESKSSTPFVVDATIVEPRIENKEDEKYKRTLIQYKELNEKVDKEFRRENWARAEELLKDILTISEPYSMLQSNQALGSLLSSLAYAQQMRGLTCKSLV
eukprot:TRINITY_DN22417_c0_g1_i2.p1 TRINITY_DN22417_c0_g1~~TRINITY_DN22417_c0_g1_i2.p1  ORF type:complete len:144 (-),score=5.56 TRINITY_DN22417_c0_g1_i2:78-509(-)